MPDPGGLLDQDEVLMHELDLVAIEIEKHEDKEREDRRREMERKGR